MEKSFQHYIDELVGIYAQVQSLSEQEKSAKEAIKADGGNPAICATVARAILADKLQELAEKCIATQQLLGSVVKS
jgi:hypothetical protein